jgi:hypothetical protein
MQQQMRMKGDEGPTGAHGHGQRQDANADSMSFPAVVQAQPAAKDTKTVKFNLPGEDEFRDDGSEFDEFEDEDFDDDMNDDPK